jgi:predicted DNA-binding transcriptional regulator YafY
MMRAARLLQMLLLLQNRGRMTSVQLAQELEVTPRTILRDVDAMTEAGLPVIVHQGNTGGIELGFNYRTRLTGLSADEAEALALVLSMPADALAALGMSQALQRARAKLVESFPDSVRAKVQAATERYQFAPLPSVQEDRRLVALCSAIRERKIIRIQSKSRHPRAVHPIALRYEAGAWSLIDAVPPGGTISLDACGDINVSARQF